ncbi:MAG: hypothetical protein IRY98_04395 [Alicyclobacillaceae bacterium]|nr:hypothetical protein [Alicyclobacillaceae bacterium]
MSREDDARVDEGLCRWLERLFDWPRMVWEVAEDRRDGRGDDGEKHGLLIARDPLRRVEAHPFADAQEAVYVSEIVRIAAGRGYPVSAYLKGGDGSRLVFWKQRVWAVCRSWNDGVAPAPVHRHVKQLFTHLGWWHWVTRWPVSSLPRLVRSGPRRLRHRWQAWIEQAPEGCRDGIRDAAKAWEGWIRDWDVQALWEKETAAGGVVAAFGSFDDWVDLGGGLWWLRRARRCRPGAPWEDAADLMARYGIHHPNPAARWEAWLSGYREVMGFPEEWKRGIAAVWWTPDIREGEGWHQSAARWVQRVRCLAAHADWFTPGPRVGRVWRKWVERLESLLDDGAGFAFGDGERLQLASWTTSAVYRSSRRRISGVIKPAVRGLWLSSQAPSLSPAGEHRHENHKQHHENEHI